MRCTLCSHPAQPFARVDARVDSHDGFRCGTCRLTFEDPATRTCDPIYARTRRCWISNTTLSPARKWRSICIAPPKNGSSLPGR